ncbi:DUF7507 domain-containing protein [Agromyces protaetiae]|nr:DUF11 domain-containing protein [Agromyces protaetiae]
MVLVAALLGGGIVVVAPPVAPRAEAATAPTPLTMWREDFENGTTDTYVGLEDYIGANGERYTASPYWLDFAQCNGFLMSGNSTVPGTCPAGTLGSMTRALGLIQLAHGEPVADVGDNFALSTFSRNNQTQVPLGTTMLQTVGTVPLQFRENPSTRTRFIGFSVDAAETACGASQQAQLVFTLGYGGQQYTVSDAIKPCSDPRSAIYGGVRGGRFYSPGSFLVDAGQPGVAQPASLVVSNLEPHGGSGNDAAIDNISVYDVTPVVEPSFVETSMPSNGTATLQFEVVNATDLAGKPGWGFDAALPDGLEMVPGSVAGGSCSATVDASGDTVSVTAGNLGAGVASCTVTVTVRPVSPPDRANPETQTFVIGADDLDQTVGVDPVGSDQIEFYFVDLAIAKSASPAEAGPGDTVAYTVTATNVGNGPFLDDFPAILVDDLTDVFDDATFNADAAFDRPGETLLAGAPRLRWSGGLDQGDTVTLTYTVTVHAPLPDESDRTLRNTAFAAETPGQATPDCDPADPDPAVPCAVHEIDLWSLAFTKTPSPTTALVGETVTYTLTTLNDGLEPLTVTDLDDPLLADLTWDDDLDPPFTLAPGDSATATGTHTLTQADVDAGGVPNTATLTAQTPLGTTVSRTASADVDAPQSPGLTVVKVAELSGPVDPVPGTPVDFSATIENTGNVTLTGVVLSDPLVPPGDISYEWPDPASPGVLAPGEFATASAPYPITQADIDSGRVVNTATVDASTSLGAPVHAVSNEETVVIGQTAAIRIVKSAVLPPVRSLGEVGTAIPYEFEITNTGNLVLENVTAADPILGTLVYGEWPGAAGRLEPGQSVTATGSVAITQADLDRGSIENTATATGTPTVPADAPTAQSNTVTVVLPSSPAIGLEKTGSVAEPVATGSTVDYVFTITNPGNLTLTGVEVSDPLLAGVDLVYTWPDPAAPGVLPPGLEATAEASLALSQSQIDAGALTNRATVTGTPPQGLDAVSDEDDAEVEWELTPSLALDGVGELDAGSRPDPGDPVRFLYTITNDGNTTLTDVDLDVPTLCADGEIGDPVWPAAAGTLLPGEHATVTATCPLTRAEIDAGGTDQTAVAVGQPPRGDPLEANASPAVVLPRLPEVRIEKSGEVADNGGAGPVYPGQVVVWHLTISNLGNVTLDPLVVDDPPVGFGSIVIESWPDRPGTLPAGMSVEATTWSVVTEADADRGYAENVGRVEGLAPDEQELDDEASARVELPESPSIALSVGGALAPGATGAVGDLVTFTYHATNTGNVTLDEVDIVDPMPGLSALVFDWPGADRLLATGESVTAVATYAVTADDVARGWVADPATASGVSPQGTTVTATADVRVPLPRRPLPASGFDAMSPVVAAVWLLLAGAVLVAARRPRRVRR